MGFQNIIKLLKSDEQNLSYKSLKLKTFRYIIIESYSIRRERRENNGTHLLTHHISPSPIVLQLGSPA